MIVQKDEAPTQKLAGKRVGAPVMSQGAKRNVPVLKHSIGSDGKNSKIADAPMDKCSRASGLTDAEVQQRIEGLVKANVVRMDRARVRRDLGDGTLHFDDFLEDVPTSCETVKVGSLLKWIPNIGNLKADLICAALPDGNAGTRMGNTTHRDKYLLSDLVGRVSKTLTKAAA